MNEQGNDSEGRETVLHDTLLVNNYHVVFIKTPRMYSTKAGHWNWAYLAHADNPNTWKAEARGLQVWAIYWCSETLSPNQK